MTASVPPALPTEGGSYIRHADGRLEKQSETPAASEAPKTPADSVTGKTAKSVVKEA